MGIGFESSAIEDRKAKSLSYDTILWKMNLYIIQWKQDAMHIIHGAELRLGTT